MLILLYVGHFRRNCLHIWRFAIRLVSKAPRRTRCTSTMTDTRIITWRVGSFAGSSSCSSRWARSKSSRRRPVNFTTSSHPGSRQIRIKRTCKICCPLNAFTSFWRVNRRPCVCFHGTWPITTKRKLEIARKSYFYARCTC